MAKYDCEVKDSKGEILKTQLEAPNMQELAARLSDKGFYLVKATEVKKSAGKSLFGGGVKAKEMMVFTTQLSTLVGAAIPLVEAVGIMADQTTNPYFKGVLEAIGRDLQSGVSFSVAIRKHPKVFDRIYCNMCEAGEAGGMLDQVLQRLAAFAESDAEIRGKIKGALMMPVIQLILAVLGVIFLLVKIFPNFAVMFKKMKTDLPKITEMMMFASDALIDHYMLCIAGALGIGALVFLALKTKPGQHVVALFSLKAPIIGELTQKIAVSRFARTFCSLLGAGVPIMQALQITASVMGNPIMEKMIADMAIGVQQGNTLASTLVKVDVFPPMVKKMIEVGENSGNLDVMLSKAADFYDRDVKEALDGLTAAITPILTVVMGIIIGTIALSVFMPLFQMSASMK
ncbi:MAG: type II secretion system F family protein [Candidatus Riflebacteria bacterium]|nr:type II secretion system F family protein [Candidatus Riflebacteria bacterium]